jgi:hypothetical protein
MTNTYAPELTKQQIINSIYYNTPGGVWAPGIVFPAGSTNPIENENDHDKDFYYGTSSGALWQYQGGDYDDGEWNSLGIPGNEIACGNTLQGSANEGDLYNKWDDDTVYQWLAGAWRSIGPNIGGLPLGTDAVSFTDINKPWRSAHLGMILVSDTGYSPVLATDAGFIVKKDITAGGFVGANQGELWLGHGRTSATDIPKIVMMHSTDGYNTLYLKQSNCSTSANLDLGDLTIHGNVHGNLALDTSNGSISLQAGGWLQWGTSAKLAMTNATRGFSGSTGLATQNGSGDLGVHLTSGLQVDHVDSATGGGISLFDDLHLWGSIAGHRLYDATNSSGSNGQFLQVNASGLPVWTTYSPDTWDGGVVTNNIQAPNFITNNQFSWNDTTQNGHSYYTYVTSNVWHLNFWNGASAFEMMRMYTNGNTEITGNVQAVQINAIGVTAQLSFADRSSGTPYVWYSNSDVAHLWRNYDLMSIDAAGNLTTAGGLTVYGNINGAGYLKLGGDNFIGFNNGAGGWDVYIRRSAANVLAIDNGAGGLGALNCSIIKCDYWQPTASGDIYPMSNIRMYTSGLNIFPQSNNNGNVGGNGSGTSYYWGAIWGYYIKYKSAPSSFDVYDDLELVRQMKTTQIDGQDVIDPETTRHLIDDHGFYESSRMDGWHLSVQRKMVEKLDEHDVADADLLSRIEHLSAEVENLKTR